MRILPEAAILAQLQSLADPIRARLLLVLDRHELTVGELCQVLQLPQSTVSRHLRTLADDEWVLARADGARRLYRLAELDDARQKLWALVGQGMVEVAATRQDALRVPAVLAQRRSVSADFFAGAAGDWDALRSELFGSGIDLRALLALFDERWTVGDLGCGTGQLAASLAPFVRRVVAVDASPAMLEAARARLAGMDPDVAGVVELRAGELEALPVTDGELDVAVLSLVLHHVVEPTAVLVEARRTLVMGGRLLVLEMLPHAHAEYRRTMGHVWQGFEPAQMETWLTDVGFRDVRTRLLGADPQALGPALFVSTARATAGVTGGLRGSCKAPEAARRELRAGALSGLTRSGAPGRAGAPPQTQDASVPPAPCHQSHAATSIPASSGLDPTFPKSPITSTMP